MKISELMGETDPKDKALQCKDQGSMCCNSPSLEEGQKK